MPKQLIIYSTEEVLEHLDEQGYNIHDWSDIDDMVDGNIDLDKNISVQVGEGYISVDEVIEDDHGFMIRHHGMVSTLDELDELLKEIFQ